MRLSIDGEPVTTEELRECFSEYAGVLHFFLDFTPVEIGGNGVGQITLADWQAMPAATMDAYNIFRRELAEWMTKQRDIAARGRGMGA